MTLDEIVTELIRQQLTAKEVKQAMMRRALFRWGAYRAAEMLGVSRETIYNYMREHGITPEDIQTFRQRSLKLSNK